MNCYCALLSVILIQQVLLSSLSSKFFGGLPRSSFLVPKSPVLNLLNHWKRNNLPEAHKIRHVQRYWKLCFCMKLVLLWLENLYLRQWRGLMKISLTANIIYRKVAIIFINLEYFAPASLANIIKKLPDVISEIIFLYLKSVSIWKKSVR